MNQSMDLAVVLPADALECEECLLTLLATVRRQAGVIEAHVDHGEHGEQLASGTVRLCVHYDPSVLRVTEVEATIKRVGAQTNARFEHLAVPLAGAAHERRADVLRAFLLEQPGVVHASIALAARMVFVQFDPSKTTRAALLEAARSASVTAEGESARSIAKSTQSHGAHGHEGHEEDAAHAHGGGYELAFSLACGALTALGWGLSKLALPKPAMLSAVIAAFVFGSWYTVKEIVVGVRAKRFEIDFLMMLAALGAAALGEWLEGSLLLFLFTLGHALEGYAMQRARNAIAALSQLAPDTAIRLDADGQEREVAVGSLAVGDEIVVKPNSRIAADGFVVAGTSAVNQASITGESVPVDKRAVLDREAAESTGIESLSAEHRVFAGTINGTGVLRVVVLRLASESTLAKLAALVARAETQKSTSQLRIDAFERRFVPIILSVVVLLMFSWVVVHEPFAKSFYRAMSVLVAASPCALAIATPSAVLAAIARAARAGVLIKGGAHLEALGEVDAIAFDKTGTLTEGQPTLTDIEPTAASDRTELLAVSASIEKRSDHPLARAIVEGARPFDGELPRFEATDVAAVIGFGVRGMLDGGAVQIGKPGMFVGAAALTEEVTTLVDRLRQSGRTVMVVRSGDRFLGVLGVMDRPRDSARAAIARLRALGVGHTVMLSGDNQSVADAVAREVGISDARGELLPEDKVAVLAKLASEGRKVAMVGDGVNDAPAMAHASVGIAMGAGGSDVALETADVALMADELHALPFAVALSRSARAVITQNLWMSLGMVAVLVPLTIAGFAGIGVAVALHEGSTLVVVANALRLLAFRERASS